MIKFKRISLIVLVLLLTFGTISAFANNDDSDSAEEENVEAVENNNEDNNAEEADRSEEDSGAAPVEGSLPDESGFQNISENGKYLLKADADTGHFVVVNKQNGKTFRSFPNPDGWEQGGASNVWQTHLQSPFMFTFVEFNVRKDVVKESNFLSQGGTVEFTKLDDGFKVTYDMPKIGFSIPIEVHLGDDFVETKVLADEIVDVKELTKEEEADKKKNPKSRLVSLRLFPFLGAETSDEENGYLFLPDGPGVLVEFQKNRASTNNLYSERIYGDDWAFSTKTDLSSRQPVRMPVFGIKKGEQATLGIVRDGDSYASIVSAPSESLSQYNWITAEHHFRFKFFQPTDKKKFTGFYLYSEEMQRTTRSVRYYMIDEKTPNYVDMAQRYRQYLIDELGLTKVEADENIDLQLSILGGGTKKGFIRDTFLPLTTADQASQIVKELNSAGVEDMTINYFGWQRGGYENFGGHFPVAKKLGGNDEMKKFVEFTQSKGFSVFLDTSSYTYNNTNKDRFRPNRDGLQDLSSTVIENNRFGNKKVYVSPRFMEKTIIKDFKKAKEIEVDGYIYGDGIGSMLSTDYNERHFANRQDVKEIHENILAKTKAELGKVQLSKGNFYALPYIDHIDQMDNDYSYDLFADRKVPFAQIALHGLVSYSFNYGNMGGNAQQSFLQGIEYGAVPSFILTYEETQKLLESDNMSRFYSTYYKDWEKEITSWYQSYNEALGDVQDQFIMDHRMLDEGVFETIYENGKRIVVNYNKHAYTTNGMTIGAEDFVVLEGGK